jgi:signal transduction histidine kinase
MQATSSMAASRGQAEPMPRTPTNTIASPSMTDQTALLAMDALSAGVIVFDRSLQVVHRNDTARRLLPDLPDVPDLLAHLASQSNYEEWRTELRRVVEQRRPRRLDISVAREDGSQSVYQIDLLALRPLDRAGVGAGGVLCVEDVTSRATLERRLAVSERLAAVGKLAARVAHELNNPLDGVMRYINLAIRRLEQMAPARGQPLDASLLRYLENAKTGATRMSEIIVGLLEFYRSAPPAFEQATVNKIVEDAVTAMEARAHDCKVTVVCHFHQTDTPVVRGSSIFQVFCNLIKNAIDAMPDGGTLSITTRLDGREDSARCIVTFCDTGSGLPDDVQKIFEPFFTAKAPGKGTGLGLAVCRELIEKCGGSIEARRGNPRGAEMVVSIPVHDPRLANRGPLPRST